MSSTFRRCGNSWIFIWNKIRRGSIVVWNVVCEIILEFYRNHLKLFLAIRQYPIQFWMQTEREWLLRWNIYTSNCWIPILLRVLLSFPWLLEKCIIIYFTRVQWQDDINTIKWVQFKNNSIVESPPKKSSDSIFKGKNKSPYFLLKLTRRRRCISLS